MVTKEQVLGALARIIDPDLGRDIVALGFITTLEIEDGHVLVEIRITTPACPVRDQFKADAERLVGQLPEVRSVTVTITSAPPQSARRSAARQPATPRESGLDQVGALIAVASCKGGGGQVHRGGGAGLRADAARPPHRPAGTPTSSVRRFPPCSTAATWTCRPGPATCCCRPGWVR